MIGILEFVTFPVDENSDEQVYQTFSHLKAIEEKGKQLIALMNTNTLIPLGEAYATGIPVKDLKRWMSGILGFRSEYSSIASDIEDFKKQAMNPVVNLQATAGILPSSIKKLYESPGLQETSSLSHIQRIALEDVNSFFNQWKENPYIRSIKNSGDYQSFYGIILLLYTYLLGNTFESIVGNLSTPKNDVPFLCKLTDMHDIITKAAPLLQKVDPEFAITVCNTLKSCPSLIPEELFKKITNSTPNPQNFRSPRVSVMDFDSVQSILTGTSKELHILSSGNTFANPDEMHDPLNRNQKGIPLEFRNLLKNVTLDTLPETCLEIMLEVRKINEGKP